MAREWIQVYRPYEYHPYDLMVAFTVVVAERFGPEAIRGRKSGWFSHRSAPTYTTVKTGIRQEVKVVQGTVELKGIPGFFTLDTEQRMLLARVPKEYRQQAENLMLAVQARLDTKSIYRGKAITSSMDFMDLSGVDVSKLVYNEKVFRDLNRHVWTLLQRGKLCLQKGIPLRRKVLFPGPFGSGKTMAALATAKVAVENDWLFFYIEPSTSPAAALGPTLETARRYGKAVVLIEDFDREQRESNPYALGQLMNQIDGALSKSGELIVIMTTNFPDKIGPGLQRPGRIDRFVNFGRFLREDAVTLLHKVIPPDMLSPDIDWSAVGKACDKYAPAFVNEMATSAMLSAICDDPDNMQVTQAMLVEAASDLAEQHKTCTQGAPGFRTEP